MPYLIELTKEQLSVILKGLQKLDTGHTDDLTDPQAILEMLTDLYEDEHFSSDEIFSICA